MSSTYGEVKIGSVIYSIEELIETLEMTWGSINQQNSTIHIKERDPQQMYITLWHEILHGLLTAIGRTDESMDESLVEGLSNAITALIIDNPTIIDPYIFYSKEDEEK
jgi:hypothetical protein